MNKEDLKIGGLYRLLTKADTIVELVNFDSKENPVLKGIKNCSMFIFNTVLSEAADPACLEGHISFETEHFIRLFESLEKAKEKKRRIWTKDELTIAFHIAKFGFGSLKTTEEHLMKNVIKNTSIRSLRHQVSKFQFILDIPGNHLSSPSLLQYDIYHEYRNKTFTQMRELVLSIINK